MRDVVISGWIVELVLFGGIGVLTLLCLYAAAWRLSSRHWQWMKLALGLLPIMVLSNALNIALRRSGAVLIKGQTPSQSEPTVKH